MRRTYDDYRLSKYRFNGALLYNAAWRIAYNRPLTERMNGKGVHVGNGCFKAYR